MLTCKEQEALRRAIENIIYPEDTTTKRINSITSVLSYHMDIATSGWDIIKYIKKYTSGEWEIDNLGGEDDHMSCEKCGNPEMKIVHDTLRAMTGNESDDDTVMYDYWQCSECDNFMVI